MFLKWLRYAEKPPKHFYEVLGVVLPDEA